jgi:peptidoglycan/LPS O-acetylase OafA/YrhL
LTPSASGIDAAPRSEPQIVFIQYLRGLAPVLVLWAHLSGFWLYAHGRGWQVNTDWFIYLSRPLNLYENAGHLGVVLFFLVSGYIVTHASRRESARTFGIKRAFRLLPALWLAVAVVAAARLIAHLAGIGYPTGTQGGGLTAYLRGAFLLDMLQNKPQINGVTWTLVVEVSFYVLTAAAITLSRRAPALATVGMLATWAGAALLLHHFPSTRYLDAMTVYVGILILGRSLYLSHASLIGSRESWWLCCAVVAVFVAVYQVLAPGVLQQYDGPANTYVLGLLLFLVFMYASPKQAPWAIRELADISYSLYLLHIPVGMLTIDLAIRAGAPFTMAFVAGVVASLIAAALSYRFVEAPARRAARHWIGSGAAIPSARNSPDHRATDDARSLTRT